MVLQPGETQAHTVDLRWLWDAGTESQQLTHTEAKQRGDDLKTVS